MAREVLDDLREYAIVAAPMLMDADWIGGERYLQAWSTQSTTSEEYRGRTHQEWVALFEYVRELAARPDVDEDRESFHYAPFGRAVLRVLEVERA